MNLLFSCIGKRGYIADFFREHLTDQDRIIATSNTPWTAGFGSCDEAHLMPDIADDGYPQAVIELCRERSIDALFSFFDPDAHRLSEFRPDLQAVGTVPVIPPQTAANICFDKYRTFEFLRANGFTTPDTYIDLQEALTAVGNGSLRYPVVVKPRTGFGSAHTYVARNERELEVFFDIGPPMLIQEKLEGEAYDFDICSDFDGKPVSVVLWRKLRSTLGETDQVITCKDEALLDLGVRLGNTIQNVGPMDVDLFLTADGHASIIEMNPRFGGGYPASHLAGADFPGLLLKLIRGEPIEARIGDYRENVVMMKKLTPFGGDDTTFWKEQLSLRR